MDNIVLTGFMGTGKTTTGRLLAARLRRTFVDTDELIVQRTGQEIAEVFDSQGPQQFRALEKQIAAELAPLQNLVIATGGRLMLDAENAAALAPGNTVIALQAHPDEIYERTAAQGIQRPLLDAPDPRERIADLLQERRPGYAQFAQISSSGRSAAEVAAEILTAFNLTPLPPSDRSTQRLTVQHPQGAYDVLVGDALLARLPQLAPLEQSRLAAISDSDVAPLYAAELPAAACMCAIPAGEAHKTLATVQTLYDELLAAGIDRSSTVIALGGGVVGDVAGFVAATYMRGLPLVQCPTTLLAMVDAAVGGKTGVDLPQGKNLVGAFKQPIAVIADLDTLRTLPPAEFAAGMAEVVKHALIAGGPLLALLEENELRQERLFQGKQFAILQEMVVTAIKVKRDIVQQDPYESGRRALLNLGHTFAHAIERTSNYGVRHGFAVAMGLVCAARLSANLGICPPSLPHRVERLLARAYLPTRIPAHLEAHDLLAAMSSDKKKMHGKLRFVLIRDVADLFVGDDVAPQAVLRALQEVST